MNDRRCADCIHLAPWPERMKFARELMETMPEDYPLWACMRHMANVRSVSPYDGTVHAVPSYGDTERPVAMCFMQAHRG